MGTPTLAFTGPTPGRRGDGGALVPAANTLAAAGSTLVAAAKVGRIFGRSYLRLARQVPGVATLEREAGRFTRAVVERAAELIDEPRTAAPATVYATADEGQVLARAHDAHATEIEPLRAAMEDLLQRSTELTSSRQYLFGSIVSQLVPDEARILATLADGGAFAAADVVVKPGRGQVRTVLANASTVGHAAGVRVPADTAAYLTRLFRFGLVDFGPADARLAPQYEAITADETVTRARVTAEAGRQGGVRYQRKTVRLSDFGREFWSAAAPPSPVLG
ncbi:MAG: Abi-alpha family protein [Jatrophihabitans sp.]|uniref:Abi-alpha family protein n=1 Tax=Jatrophihabitans sp. TaxID=1932789 RepID=UPI003F7F51E5